MDHDDLRNAPRTYGVDHAIGELNKGSTCYTHKASTRAYTFSRSCRDMRQRFDSTIRTCARRQRYTAVFRFSAEWSDFMKWLYGCDHDVACEFVRVTPSPELIIRERGGCTLQFICRRSMVATVNEMEFVTLAESFHSDCIYCVVP